METNLHEIAERNDTENVRNKNPVLTECRTSDVASSTIFRVVERTPLTSGCGSLLRLGSGSIKEPKRKVSAPVFGRKPLPKIFSFTTWWNENGKRVHMLMDYFPETKTWRVKVDVPMSVNIYTREGNLLEPYDLHVGARLDVLGRVVTLRKASLDAITWLDDQARSLLKKKLQLETELGKFTHVPITTTEQVYQHESLTKLNPHYALGGTVNLRGLRDELVHLSDTLEKYRPSFPSTDNQVSNEIHLDENITQDKLPQG
mmetsp:Transcript_35984/g.49961  ORF Transcript_35984/g.49961 Transcript_35984/m.49961 type:complete len:259 (+) Transcript_35984:117-893(+)|eukprot:CAMPEP_0196573548 /NCGR_PEP_ID=MMETSP1081-20130531/3433_1 /TAXON_ID=36882 /ORGANISM="Pyramimonas amylifera, Strain CCMP720" /LENGTH=258 /DNA_ID=CAMNT_0041891293 /DNA_START=112 /DNA_END=888 /DNA_ORIENTATION=-